MQESMEGILFKNYLIRKYMIRLENIWSDFFDGGRYFTAYLHFSYFNWLSLYMVHVMHFKK